MNRPMSDAEELHEYLSLYVASLPEEQREIVERLVKRGAVLMPAVDPLMYLSNVMIELRRTIAAEDDRRTGRDKWMRLAKQMERAAIQRDAFGVVEQDGAQYLCDGCRAVKLPMAIDYPRAERPTDIRKRIEDAAKNPHSLPLPQIYDLRDEIRKERAKRKNRNVDERKMVIALRFESRQMPVVNAVFLLELMRAMPNAAATWKDKHSPIYLQDGEAAAAMMPLVTPGF